MAKRKASHEPRSPFLGRWHIVSMSMWAEIYVNEEVQAYIQFEENQHGDYQFCLIRGQIDYREGVREGKSCVEWTWEGNDEMMDQVLGRGWAVLEGEALHGMFFIHFGDESEFEARRADQAKRWKRRSPSGRPPVS
jgi:hypothetical protein